MDRLSGWRAGLREKTSEQKHRGTQADGREQHSSRESRRCKGPEGRGLEFLACVAEVRNTAASGPAVT